MAKVSLTRFLHYFPAAMLDMLMELKAHQVAAPYWEVWEKAETSISSNLEMSSLHISYNITIFDFIHYP